MKVRMPLTAWLLLGLLAISLGLMSLGQSETQTKPTVESYSPSGTAALRAFLSRRFPVLVDRRPNPRLKPQDVLVVFYIPQVNFFEEVKEFDFQKVIDRHLRQGGRALVLPLSQDFASISARAQTAEPQVVKDLGDGRTFKVSTAPVRGAEGGESEPTESRISLSLWEAPTGTYVEGFRVGNGSGFRLESGLLATNRYLDQHDNAAVLTRLLERLHQPGGSVVLAEASFGNARPPGLLETIGKWAEAAWQQVLFLGLVVAYTLGRRFGIPETSRPPQRGTRELLDAVSDTLLRRRDARPALSLWLEQTDARLRQALKVPMGLDRAERDRHLPQSLISALRRVEAAAVDEARLNTRDALPLVQKAEAEVNAFLGVRRTPTAPPQ